jgi:hypothetical protein
MNTFELENRVRQREQAVQEQMTQQHLARIARLNEKSARKSGRIISTTGGFTQLMLALMR